jgi:hypothetical protein
MANVKRPTRTPLGARSRLAVKGREPGFHYRIVNDVEGRIQDFIDAGYEVVSDDGVTVGDKRIANPTQEGSPVKVHVGGGNQAYLMRIKDEWYSEDQSAKQAQINELEDGMKAKAKENSFYGDIKISK